MMIEVEAKFNNKDTAYNAYSKINETLSDVEKADLITEKTLHSYIEDHRNSRMRKGLLKFLLFGALGGVLIGLVINLIVSLGTFEATVGDNYNLIFMVVGLITGTICATLIYFILREKVVPISDYDLSRKEALVVVSIPKKLLPRLKRILFSSGAKSVTTV